MNKVKMLIAVVVVGLGAKFGVAHLLEQHFIDSQTERVTKILEQLETKATLEEQHAMTLWADEDVIIDGSILEQRSDNFTNWRQAGGFHWVDDFEIRSSTVEKQAGSRGLRIECTINGEDLTMMAKDGEPIRWVT